MAVTEDQAKKRIKYAKTLHGAAQSKWEEVKVLLTGEYETRELEDLGIEIFKPAKPKALFGKALSIVGSRARQTIEIVPLTGQKGEEERCTKLEKFAQGVMRRGAEGRRIDPYLEWLMWYLARGKGALEWRYFPQYTKEDSPRFPIRPIAPNANTICEVAGDAGVLYYAKVYKRLWLDLQTELEQLHGGGKTEWEVPSVSKKDTEWVTVEEYWDKETKGLFVEGKKVWLNPHNYGFCPIVVVYCEPLPLDEPEYWGEGLLLPIKGPLVAQARMVAKLLSALELHYWPWVLVQFADGESTIFQAVPGGIPELPPDAKVTVIQPTPNAPLLEQLNAWLEGDINTMTGLPPMAFGQEPGGAPSGYMVAQILGQILDRYQQKVTDIGVGLAEHLRQLFMLTHRVLEGEVTGSDPTEGKGFSVDTQPEKGQRRRAMITVKEEDVEDQRQINVDITPTLPQEMRMKVEMADRLRQPGKTDGRPLLSDESLRGPDYLNVESPEEERERIEKQVMEAQIPEIQQAKQQEYLEKYEEEHKEGRGMPRLTERQVIELVQRAVQEALQQFIQTGQIPPQLMPPPAAPAPMMAPPGAPPGAGPAPPGVPPEMGGSVVPGQAPPGPEELLMQQMGGMPPRPGGM